MTSRPAVAERLRFLQNAIGAVPGPFDCFLVLRGLRTLALRAERHATNAAAIAVLLAGRDDIELVRYPGLRTGRHAHPQAAIAARQMRGAGGMVSFIPRAGGPHGRTGRERAIAICESTRLFTLAESLGGVESLIELPAVMTHASVAGSPLAVDPALIRLSCGIEDAADGRVFPPPGNRPSCDGSDAAELSVPAGIRCVDPSQDATVEGPGRSCPDNPAIAYSSRGG